MLLYELSGCGLKSRCSLSNHFSYTVIFGFACLKFSCIFITSYKKPLIHWTINQSTIKIKLVSINSPPPLVANTLSCTQMIRYHNIHRWVNTYSQTIQKQWSFRKIYIKTIIKLFDNIYVELDANEACSFTFYYLEFTIWVIWVINSITEPNVWEIAILFRLMIILLLSKTR